MIQQTNIKKMFYYYKKRIKNQKIKYINQMMNQENKISIIFNKLKNLKKKQNIKMNNFKIIYNERNDCFILFLYFFYMYFCIFLYVFLYIFFIFFFYIFYILYLYFIIISYDLFLLYFYFIFTSFLHHSRYIFLKIEIIFFSLYWMNIYDNAENK